MPENVYTLENFGEKFFISFYSSILALLGNDIYPTNESLYLLASCMLLFGAILQASIFGQVATIVQSMNRK